MIKHALFFLLFSFGLSSTAYSGDIEDAMSRANRFVKARDYQRAIKEYEAALKLNPTNAKTYLLLGLVYANTNDLDNALKFTEKALTLDPSYSAYNNLALVYANKGDFEKALSNYDKASELNPSAHTPWYHKGLIYSSKNDHSSAASSYKKAVELNPQFAEAYVGLGSALYHTGDKEGARKQVEKLKELKFKTQGEGLEEWIQSKEKPAPPPTSTPSLTPSTNTAQD